MCTTLWFIIWGEKDTNSAGFLSFLQFLASFSFFLQTVCCFSLLWLSLIPALRFAWTSVLMPSTQMASKPKKSIPLLPCIISKQTTHSLERRCVWAPPEPPLPSAVTQSWTSRSGRTRWFYSIFLPLSRQQPWCFESVEHEGRCWWGSGKAVTPTGSASPRMAGLACKGGGKGGDTAVAALLVKKGGRDSSRGGSSWRSGGSTTLESWRERVGGGGQAFGTGSGENSCSCCLMMEQKGWAATPEGPFVAWGRSISVYPVVASQHSVVMESIEVHHWEAAHISRGTINGLEANHWFCWFECIQIQSDLECFLDFRLASVVIFNIWWRNPAPQQPSGLDG